ncbi:multicopper oxidase type 3 [Perkinsela sp. CCAP 1560/4]|nr:multicopper oxidase type 3 [Perkinsela sp. CCAP 1560/4]|eukprot:KNH03758.1 multicopper oxidase type 3 [Perkinsela sp. CCAP 1560/4]
MIGIGVLFTKHLTQKRKQWKEGIVVSTPPNIFHLRECVDMGRILTNGHVSMSDLRRCASDVIATAYHKHGPDDALRNSLPEALFDGYLIDPKETECPIAPGKAYPTSNGPLPRAPPDHLEGSFHRTVQSPTVSKRPAEHSASTLSERMARCTHAIAEERKRWKISQTYTETMDVPQGETKRIRRTPNLPTAGTATHAASVRECQAYDDALHQHLTGLIAQGEATQAAIDAVFDYGTWHVPIFRNTPRRRDAMDLVDGVFPLREGG